MPQWQWRQPTTGGTIQVKGWNRFRFEGGRVYKSSTMATTKIRRDIWEGWLRWHSSEKGIQRKNTNIFKIKAFLSSVIHFILFYFMCVCVCEWNIPQNRWTTEHISNFLLLHRCHHGFLQVEITFSSCYLIFCLPFLWGIKTAVDEVVKEE